MKTNAANVEAYAKDPKKLATDVGKTVNAAVTDAANVIKTINPAGILVRTGILLSMENNIMKLKEFGSQDTDAHVRDFLIRRDGVFKVEK